MPYRYIDNIAIADVAFEAWDSTPEGLFASAADATLNAMVENLDSIREETKKSVSFTAESLEMLLFQLLQEILFFKDSEQLLLRVSECTLSKGSTRSIKIRAAEENDISETGALPTERAPANQMPLFELTALLKGEKIDPSRHRLIVDVKAVTLYRFSVKRTSEGWRASIVLDV